MAEHTHIDEVSGVETTGHEWDGIRELNTPLPRWWLWIFYGCILWAIGYWIAMPAWPLLHTYTHGLLNHSQRRIVAQEMAAAHAAQAKYLDQIKASSLEQIRTNPQLLEFALAGGKAVFAVHCSQCHGSGAQGSKGFPNLNDDEWLWGGTLDAIHYTITHGVRNDQDPDARQSQMPAFFADGILNATQVNEVANYVMQLSGEGAKDPTAAKAGAKIFADNCAACHGDHGQGTQAMGAPPLNNQIWLYGGDLATITHTVRYARHGVMPPWGKRLGDVTVKELTIYVHSLGGGQ